MKFQYTGGELELFQDADTWKSYITKMILPAVRGSVLEVGAGIGDFTRRLHGPLVENWTSLEPDATFCRRIEQRRESGELPSSLRVLNGTLQTVPEDRVFDTIIYLDVLEHIEHDHFELEMVERHLCPGGRLVILVPALPFLYSEFDRTIGHFRRYTRRSLKSVAPRPLKLERCHYLDSAGFLLSLGNRMILKQGQPTRSQVMFWDRAVVPVSKVMDRLLMYQFGKNLLGIWSKPA